MQVIIYGKDNCPNCDKSKMLCRIKSLDFTYHRVGRDISVDELHERIGVRATSLPQILLDHGDTTTCVGGYDDLKATLERTP